jgi:hypothetical protein
MAGLIKSSVTVPTMPINRLALRIYGMWWIWHMLPDKRGALTFLEFLLRAY